jgi:hypothetical protein
MCKCGHSVICLDVPQTDHIQEVQKYLQDCQQTETFHKYKIILISTPNVLCFNHILEVDILYMKRVSGCFLNRESSILAHPIQLLCTGQSSNYAHYW